MRQVSIGTMIEQLEGLLDTKDLSDWAQGFVANVVASYRRAGNRTHDLSSAQVEKIEELYREHFA